MSPRSVSPPAPHAWRGSVPCGVVDTRCTPCARRQNVDRYVQRPLLLKGKKFDLRAYMLIGCCKPDMVFFREGYCRLSLQPYDLSNLDDRYAHLTNQAVQKKHERYEAERDDTVWSMQQLNEYVNAQCAQAKGLDQDWVLTSLKKQMQSIMMWCYHAGRRKLDRRTGFFDLLGFDFLVDENMQVWLIEINDNPSLSTATSHFQQDMPEIVGEAIAVATEAFDLARQKQPIVPPLAAQERFELLFMDSGKKAPVTWSKLAQQARQKLASQPAQTPTTADDGDGTGASKPNAKSKGSDKSTGPKSRRRPSSAGVVSGRNAAPARRPKKLTGPSSTMYSPPTGVINHSERAREARRKRLFALAKAKEDAAAAARAARAEANARLGAAASSSAMRVSPVA